MKTGCVLKNRSQKANLDRFQNVKPVSFLSLTIKKKNSCFGLLIENVSTSNKQSQTALISVFKEQSETALRIMHFE